MPHSVASRVHDPETPEAEAVRRRAALHRDLLAWYDRHARRLPWRALPGERPDPYRVWLSEIMLQQTTVAAVAPYFEAFLARWPDVEALAAAPQEEVLAAWAGLGYYARARNLHRCARVVTAEHGGRFPESVESLRKLPGIGDYTAAAVGAIAFDRPVLPVDGNIERVVARLLRIERPLPAGKRLIRTGAAALAPEERPGDLAQAMMDLGASLCVPARPKCVLCPISNYCAGRKAGVAERLPARAPKAEKPTRRGVAFWVVREDGAVLLRRRAQTGLLGGMMEVPSTEWRPLAGKDDPGPGEGEVLSAAPLDLAWEALPGEVRHTFTHFHLRLAVWVGRAPAGTPLPGGSGWDDARWVVFDDLDAAGLPTVMAKIVRHTLRKGG